MKKNDTKIPNGIKEKLRGKVWKLEKRLEN